MTLLYSITTVCDDRAWLLGHTATIKQLADTAASKFAVYDAVMHTKLCVALAAANVCPAADWWVPCWSILQSQLHSGNSAVRAVAGCCYHVLPQTDPPQPAALRLTRQQAALVSCLRGGEPVGQAVAQDLRDVYRTWDVEVEGSELASFL